MLPLRQMLFFLDCGMVYLNRSLEIVAPSLIYDITYIVLNFAKRPKNSYPVFITNSEIESFVLSPESKRLCSQLFCTSNACELK